MNGLAHSSTFWVLLILGAVVIYILPSLIGAARRVECLGWLIVINLLPTGIGWLAAMIGALMLPRREQQGAFIVQTHRLAPASTPRDRDEFNGIADLLVKADQQRHRSEPGRSS